LTALENLELDTAIDELETRVERLRSLYEQYFMGIEKIAPAVAHKDVTRRIDILRHEQIRNTAKRFRLQMIIQRYNTFQQYWQRILREIENGTYKRHVLRAERSIASMRVSSIPSPPVIEALPVADLPPESDRGSGSRQRKSMSPSSPKHSLAESQRHSSLPPAEKVEAFTRALERDLAAALDGDLDFGSIKGELNEASLDLDAPASVRKPFPKEVQRAPLGSTHVTGTNTPGVAVHPLRMPAQSAVGGHRLPPLPARTAATTQGSQAVQTRSAAGVTKPTPKAATEEPIPTSAASGLGAERVRQLHRELVEAKAKTNDKAEVSLSALTRRLEVTSQQLSQKHGGKHVDFAVVIKDGKAVVKPIVR
jgi:hypothetical protein